MPHCRTAALLLCVAMPAWAADPVEDLANLTGANLGVLSASLSQHQREMNGIMARRIDMVMRQSRRAADAQFQIEREVATLSETDGDDIAQLFERIRTSSDKSAQVPILLEAAQLQLKNEINAGYTPLAISTEGIDASAGALATLTKPKSRADRFKFIRSYLLEVHTDVKTLKEKAAASAAAGDKAAAGQDAKVSESLTKPPK